jgi:opacity protein-like surface antigen
MLAEILLGCFASVPVVPPVLTARPPVLEIAPLAPRSPVAACVAGADSDGDDDGVPSPVPSPADPKPARVTPPPAHVEWRSLGAASIRFVAVMHAFRWATEPGTRAGGFGLGQGYRQSVLNLHGWADGDPFYVNYVGHPFQGAISGRLFLLNDPRYKRAEFGRSRDYWKGKLRATAFAWAFSEQFEIGALSEASVGHIQKDFPQEGFVDHVVTPVVGLSWMLGEDAVDRYVIKPIEGETRNRWVRLALRTGLNPARSFANLMAGKVPWYRDSRAGILQYTPEPKTERPAAVDTSPVADSVKEAATFEFAVEPSWRQFAGGGCVGGGADAAYRIAPDFEVALAVSGCKLTGLPADVTGDALIYQIGPRWTPLSTSRWSPYAHLLVGGMKITHEQLYPDLKVAVEEANQNLDPKLSYTLHDQYTRREDKSGLAITAGTGVDYKLSDALAIRVARIEYLYSNLDNVGGMSYGRGLQVSAGMVLRIGTW